MRVLVTGASGFVGKRLCEVLQADGHEVVRAGRVGGGSMEVFVGDIGPATDWTPTFEPPIDAVVHLAARVHVMHETAADALAAFRRVNVEGTLHLARQAIGAGVRRFVYVSSIKVNGELTSPGNPYREDDRPAPQEAYAISKHEAEIGLQALAQATGLEVVIIRPPLVYGPGVKGNFASMVGWVRRGLPLPFGAVENARSMIALENLAGVLSLCADRERSPAAANQTFLVADDETVSTTELLKKVAKAYGVPIRLIRIPAGVLRLFARMLGRSGMADRLLGSLVVDGSKARHLLGWRPVVTIDEQLGKMAQYAENA